MLLFQRQIGLKSWDKILLLFFSEKLIPTEIKRFFLSLSFLEALLLRYRTLFQINPQHVLLFCLSPFAKGWVLASHNGQNHQKRQEFFLHACTTQRGTPSSYSLPNLNPPCPCISLGSCGNSFATHYEPHPSSSFATGLGVSLFERKCCSNLDPNRKQPFHKLQKRKQWAILGIAFEQQL